MKRAAVILALMLVFPAACSRFPEDELKRAKLEIESLYYSDLPRHLPDEWTMMKDVWQKLEEAERDRDRENVLRWYYYTLQKTEMLEDALDKIRKDEEERARKEKEEIERIKKENERIAAAGAVVPPPPETEPKAKKEPAARRERNADYVRARLEKRYPSFYTVKEGEILEKIAELPAIYNDKYQWPLIYKYNRNQIRDPKKLYKGQILKIPRTVAMDEVYKSREEGGAVNPRSIPRGVITPERYRRFMEELTAEE